MSNKFYDILQEMLKAINSSRRYKEIMNVDDVVEYTGFSRSYVYRLTSDRQIPHYKVKGRSLFFKKKEIDQWLTINKVPPIDSLLQNALTNIFSNQKNKNNGKSIKKS